MNPSTEDILAAVQATPAKNVFVLPNNKNIVMAAQQAAEIADRNVIVTPAVPFLREFLRCLHTTRILTLLPTPRQ